MSRVSDGVQEEGGEGGMDAERGMDAAFQQLLGNKSVTHGMTGTFMGGSFEAQK